MKKKIISTISLFAMLLIYSQAQAQKVIIDEDFNTNKNGWVTYTSDKPNFVIYNGKLIFAVTDSFTYNIFMPVTLEDGVNFSLTVNSTHTDGTTNYGYGIFFGASDINNYYAFTITSGGYYRLAKTTAGGGYSEIIKWTTSPAIKNGHYTDNILQLSRQGANWILAVNGQTLATVPAVPFIGNKIGFTLSSMQRVEFDNLKIVQN